MTSKYIYTSERLGFRVWTNSDIEPMYQINQSSKVMEFFPVKPNLEDTKAFILRMQEQFNTSAYCYFAVDILKTKEFIGFIGLSNQVFSAEFTPCVDIGWRLNEKYWKKGYATEGANASLNYAFNTLKLDVINAICPQVNVKSEHIMIKIGMSKALEFKHSLLKDYPILESCWCYEITKESFHEKS